MRAVLICPEARRDVRLLSAEAPLAASPALGNAVVEYWMSHLACAGAKEVALLACDRPEAVHKLVGSGSRWGLEAEVFAEPQEPTKEEAAEKYGAEAIVLDHFPGLPEHPLFESYEGWFRALQAWMPRAMTPHRVGARELSPGIWVGLRGHISPQARLSAPCWLGDHVYVGAHAVIGPGTILENGAFVEPKAEIINSVIGPATFVGQYTQIKDSLAWGNTLINWQTGLESEVSDEFLLCSLNSRTRIGAGFAFLDRIEEWLARWHEEPDLEPQPALVKK